MKAPTMKTFITIISTKQQTRTEPNKKSQATSLSYLPQTRATCPSTPSNSRQESIALVSGDESENATFPKQEAVAPKTPLRIADNATDIITLFVMYFGPRKR
mmetsp:Transcript_25824/g.43914  ORF Transcript_25824/g.43914 Transcript_25824/m.43914 type:complete len:102 (-) Transcript_25824:106-411(-)